MLQLMLPVAIHSLLHHYTIYAVISVADSVSVKEDRKTRRSAPSGIPSSDVQSPSTYTEQHRTKTGPIRKPRATSRQRKRITSLTLADHDASQTTLEDHNFVHCSQATPPVSTYLPYTVSPNRCERIRKRLFPSPSGVYMCTVACMHASCGHNICLCICIVCLCIV